VAAHPDVHYFPPQRQHSPTTAQPQPVLVQTEVRLYQLAAVAFQPWVESSGGKHSLFQLVVRGIVSLALSRRCRSSILCDRVPSLGLVRNLGLGRRI
jgi:hypothetical protein